MSENLFKKIEDLYRSHKITEEEKKALLKALGYSEERQIGTSQLQLNLRSADVEIIGTEDIDFPQFEKGSLRMKEEGGVLIFEEFINGPDFIKIFVPYKSSIYIKTVSSDISVSSILGFLQVQAISSDVKLSNISDRIVVSLISGDTELKEVFGTLNITTKSGDIKLEKGKVNAVFKTYSGDIQANKIDFKDSRFNTFNGDVSLDSVSFFGRNSINTYFGDVTISLANKALVKANSTLGNIVKDISNLVSGADSVEIETKFGDILIKEDLSE